MTRVNLATVDSNGNPVIGVGDNVIVATNSQGQAVAGPATSSVASGTTPAPTWQILAWAAGGAYTLSSATRNSNEAITTASVVWPDGATGTYTATTLSTAFPGSTDAYTITYVWSSGGGGTHTVTQAAVTRDGTGGVTAQPTLTIV